MRLIKIFSLAWPVVLICIAFDNRKNGRHSFIINILKQCYYGFDPKKYRGILTGFVYAIVDAYVSSKIIDYFLDKRKRKADLEIGKE